ncbi:DUF3313 family protein [Brevundimonas sp. GCM10030266]|uniref:DUF3313 family protein n=1 Tax=Brevundimonas sp. GCM10030266 TaxID=3273386 RepID=UPI00361CAF9F
MTKTLALLAPVALAAGLSACHTTAAPDSGYLGGYSDMTAQKRGMGANVRQSRDDAASDAVTAVFLEPAVFAPAVGERLTDVERAMVLREVDRQICYEVSERFNVVTAPSPDAARVRTAVVRLHHTGRFGSAASVAAGYFVPVINLRVPGQTGGLAIESEMLDARSGRQIASIAWARNAQWVGRDSPSLSRVGDVLQMAEPLGDAVGDAFSTSSREVTENPDPDPCAAFGSRNNLGRDAASFAFGFATGLYSPEVAGTGARRAPPQR